jgi:hypothetical protein
MENQFATEAGGLKIFVDMSDPISFFQKLEMELLPRLVAGPKGFTFPARETSYVDMPVAIARSISDGGYEAAHSTGGGHQGRGFPQMQAVARGSSAPAPTHVAAPAPTLVTAPATVAGKEQDVSVASFVQQVTNV